ncbi:MAG: hypothetical protein IH591_09530 [Bacteroidales bacterium]|nr:hypothetical protein [Bacteroidales bacterium]
MKNVLFLLVIGFAAFSCANKGDIASFKVDQELFLKTFEDIDRATELALDLFSDTSQILTENLGFLKEIERAVKASRKISDQYLEYLHPDLKTQYRENFISSYEGVLINAGPSPDMVLAEKLDLKINAFVQFMDEHQEEIDHKIAEVDNSKRKTFGRMFLILFVAQFPAILVFSFVILIVLSPFAIIGRFIDNMNSFLKNLFVVTLALVANPLQIYYWSLWAAFCVFTAGHYTPSPPFKGRWLYFFTAFIFLNGPIGWLSYKEKQTAQTGSDLKRINEGTSFYAWTSIIAFLVFAIWPKVLEIKLFSWVNNLIY